jgi:hypothetical protein
LDDQDPPVEEDTPEMRLARAAEALRFGFDTGEA